MMNDIDLSLNEVKTTTLRAARGAGMAWGVAEDAGRAVRWLASFKLPWADVFIETLQRHTKYDATDLRPRAFIPDIPWSAMKDKALCPILSGEMICDHSIYFQNTFDVSIKNIAHPLLLAPFIAETAHILGKTLTVKWNMITLKLDGHTLYIERNRTHLADTVAYVVHCNETPLRNNPGYMPTLRTSIGRDKWKTILGYAEKTYAPATEASRILGAGTKGPDKD